MANKIQKYSHLNQSHKDDNGELEKKGAKDRKPKRKTSNGENDDDNRKADRGEGKEVKKQKNIKIEHSNNSNNRRNENEDEDDDQDTAKYALLVGNTNYKRSGCSPLANPVNDVKTMKAIFEEWNYKVTALYDVETLADMEAEVAKFIEPIKQGDTVVFFYSGHGEEVQSENHLIMTRHGTYTLQHLYDLVRSRKLKLFGGFFDACRNLFATPARGRGPQRNPMVPDMPLDLGNNVFFSFACASDASSLDSHPENPNQGLYTECLRRAMSVGSVNTRAGIFECLSEVCKIATVSSKKDQIPWFSAAIPDKDVYL